MKSQNTVCLDRALSKLGILSRTKALEYILAGRVKVDGKVTKEPNKKVVPEIIKIEIDNKLQHRAKNITIAFYKPQGVVTTTSDEKNRKTIFEYLPKKYGKLVTVGRLDMNTSGLLLLTTNTQLANYLTDPANAIPRVYIAMVEGLFTEDKVKACLAGIENQGEILRAKEILILKSSNKESLLQITLIQGKNREIRRLMEQMTTPVLKLKRISFGKVSLDLEKPGDWKIITDFN